MGACRILVVDDEREVVQSLAIRLRSKGYTVITAADGVEATQKALTELPDVIILDIGLPGGNGHVVAARIRRSDVACKIPIIFLTARSTRDDFRRAYETGVDRYLTKPYKPEDLMMVVEELTFDAKRQRVPEEAAAAPVP